MRKTLPRLLFNLIFAFFLAAFLQTCIDNLFVVIDSNWCNSCINGRCTEIGCSPRYKFNYVSIFVLLPIFIISDYVYRLLSKIIDISKITLIISLVIILIMWFFYYRSLWRRQCRVESLAPGYPVTRGSMRCPHPLAIWTWGRY